MAIQNRRGNYSDFDPNKLVPGELAFVQQGDTTTSTGKGVYACFNTGDVQRLSTYEEVSDEIEQALEVSTTLQAYVETAVEDVMEEHPEWHTQIDDGAVTPAKLSNKVRETHENLLKDSINLSATYWTLNGTVTRDILDPFGNQNAIRLVGTSAVKLINNSQTNNPITFPKTTYRLSVWLRSSSIPDWVTLQVKPGLSHIIDGISSDWKQFELDIFPATVSDDSQIEIGGFNEDDSPVILDIYYPRLTILDMPQYRLFDTANPVTLSSDSTFLLQTSEGDFVPGRPEKIDYDTLAEAILDKLTTKTYADVAGGTRTLIDAINLLQNGSGLYNNALYTATGSNSASGSAITDGSYARVGRTGSADSYTLAVTTKDTNGNVKYNTIATAAGDFLPLYYKILSVTNLQVTYSGSSVADKSTMQLTGTYTRNSRTSVVYLIPRLADRGYFTNVTEAQSGTSTTWTVTATIRNVTGSAQTSASARVYVIQCEK